MLELNALPSTDAALWVLMVQETDVLQVNDGDPFTCGAGSQAAITDTIDLGNK